MGVGDGSDGRSAEVDDATSVRRFLDMSIDLLGICDLQTTLLEVSESWERNLGWSRSELIGSPLIDYFHPDDLPRIEAELAELLLGGEAVAVVVRVRAKDGSYRWVQGNARSDLAAERIYVTAADITERKQLEDALVRHLSLEELVATITTRFIGADEAQVVGEIERGISELAEALGADRAHFLRGTQTNEDITYVEWLHPETGQHPDGPDPIVTEWWFEMMRTGQLVRIDDVDELLPEAPEVAAAMHADSIRSVLHVPLRMHRRYWGFLALVAVQEQVPFTDDATALLRLSGEAFMTALARADDAAALLDARRELEHRNEDLERSNEELERFAYAAAHDLKAPLARIEMALAATPVPAGDAGKLVDVARRGASRMRQLIEDLLTFAAVGTRSGDADVVDLEEVLDHVLADLATTIAASGAQVTRGPLPAAWGHRTLLGQLLQNLVSNSLKFVRSDVAPVIAVTAERDPGGVTLRVADNGIGVEAGRRSEVFGVFTRLNPDDQFPGSGIGLATCAKVVAHHGGEIWLEDGLDGGSAVVVHLPPGPRRR